MKENFNSITKKKIKAKRASPIGKEDCEYSFRTIPISLAMVEKWAEELPQWIKDNPTAKTITQFQRWKGVRQETYNRLVRKHDVLAEAHENAMRDLGERLWGRSVDKEADWKPVHFMLHNYAPEFREANKVHAELKKAEGELANANTVVHAHFHEAKSFPKKEE